MILEWLESHITPASPLARRYGMVYNSIALGQRAQRCRRAWAPHLDQCRSLIEKNVLKLKRTDHLVILGSAHLHEVPKALLERTFKKVTLVDLVHPRAVRQWAKRFRHVELIEQDVSGVLDAILKIDDPMQAYEFIKNNQPDFFYKADLIISSNLISQLHLGIIDHYAQLKKEAPENYNDLLGQLLAEKHLAALKKCQGRLLVYGDRHIIYRNTQGKINYQGHYDVDMQGFEFIKKWTWHIAPLGEYAKNESIDMIVEAYFQDAAAHL